MSELISSRSSNIQASLIGQSRKEIKSASSLESELKKIWINTTSNRQNIDKIRNLADKYNIECSSNKQNLDGELHNALELLQANCNLVADRIKKGIQISNGGAIIGSSSALVSVVSCSNQLNLANNPDFKYLNNIIGNRHLALNHDLWTKMKWS